MSNATRALLSPLLPGTLGPGTAARLSSAPPSPALAQLMATHNNSQDSQQLFLTTTAAQVISGIFVWSALIVTFHQVWARAETGLGAGTDARASLLIAPQVHCKSLSSGWIFPPVGARRGNLCCREPVLAAGEGGLCPCTPQVAARARSSCRASALPKGSTQRGFSSGTPGSVALGCGLPAALKCTASGHGFGCCTDPCC